MAIAIQASDGSGGPPTIRDIDAAGNNFIYALARLVFSGSYSTGGDTLDLTPLVAAGIPSSQVVPVYACVDANGSGTSQGAGGGYYVFLAGTNLTNNKVKIFAAGGIELAAGAYGAAVTGDVVILEVYFRKMQ